MACTRRGWTRAMEMVAAAGASMVLGCLPVGGPPQGQQLVHDRTLTSAFFTPAESEAVPSNLLSTGPYHPARDASTGQFQGATVTDLYVHSAGAVGTAPGLAALRPVLENVAPIQLGVVGRSPPSDSLGRLFLTTRNDQLVQLVPGAGWDPTFGIPSPYEIKRYDPGSGTVLALTGTLLRFSPSRARVFAGDAPHGVLLDAQGSRPLTDVNGPVFIGEDFYYVAASRTQPVAAPSTSTLTRIQPNAEPEGLLSSSGYLAFNAIEGGQTPQLLVQQSPATSTLPALFMLDPATLAITSLPSDLGNPGFEASPSGRWLLFNKMSAPTSGGGYPVQTITVYDLTTGARTDLSSRGVGSNGTFFQSGWRPGHDELWIQTDSAMIMVTEPGDVVTTVPVNPAPCSLLVHAPGGDQVSMFTPDGQYWFLRGPDPDGPTYIAPVDDPTVAPVQVNPRGMVVDSYWRLDDGRLLVGASGEDKGRQELYLVDPAAGAWRGLAGGGQVVALGKARVLALLAWDGGRNSGSLTLIELASGAQTVLAEDVYLAAVDPGHFADVAPDTDALAAGTAIVFLSRGRFPSPYDGLWVTRLP